MKRVHLIRWIIMHAGFIKWRCAVSGFMDVHAEETGSVGRILVRQMENFDLYDDTAGISIIESGISAYRIGRISLDFCNSSRAQSG